MALGDIIRSKRKELQLTQDRVAGRAGISKPYLSNIETGRTKNPPTDAVLRALERALRFDSGQLMRLAHIARTPMDIRDEQEKLRAQVTQLRGALKGLLGKPTQRPISAADMELLSDTEANVQEVTLGRLVPIINRVSAGYPHEFTDLDYPPSVADEYIRCPDVHDPQAFAARVIGDSMAPDYKEGDIIIFAPSTPARNGNDCFVRFESDGGTTFKRAYIDDERTIRLQPINPEYPAATYPNEQITGLWPAIYRIERLR